MDLAGVIKAAVFYNQTMRVGRILKLNLCVRVFGADGFCVFAFE